MPSATDTFQLVQKSTGFSTQLHMFVYIYFRICPDVKSSTCVFAAACTSLCDWTDACRAPCCGHMCQCPGPRSRPWQRDAPPALPQSGDDRQTHAPRSCHTEARQGSGPGESPEHMYPPGEGRWETKSSSASCSWSCDLHFMSTPSLLFSFHTWIVLFHYIIKEN